MGSIVHRSVPTNLKWLPNCSHAHALFQDRFKDVQVGSRWFSTLYILSPNFHMFAWQWIGLLRLGVAQFCFGLLMCCLFLGSPFAARLPTRQLCGSGCICRPEFSIIRLKNNSIHLKPDEPFVNIGVSIS